MAIDIRGSACCGIRSVSLFFVVVVVVVVAVAVVVGGDVEVSVVAEFRQRWM